MSRKEDLYTCRNCHFSANDPYMGGALICRRYPPVVDPHRKVGSVFPSVEGGDKCGEILLKAKFRNGMQEEA
jgi:hypothetical protein